jgi:hypothetical protein
MHHPSFTACRIVYKADYEAQEEEDNPAHTFEGLCQLLAFADAVDSADGLMDSLMVEVHGLQLHGLMDSLMVEVYGLQLHAKLGEQQVVLSPSDGDFIVRDLQLLLCPFGGSTATRVGEAAANSKQMEDFTQQVAAQTEQLLWLAYRLQLEPVVKRLHGFIQALCMYHNSVLNSRVNDVFTPRVLEAAGASGMAASRQAVVGCVLPQELVFCRSQPCTI